MARYAFLIGTNTAADLAGFAPLAFAERDRRRLYDTLTRFGGAQGGETGGIACLGAPGDAITDAPSIAAHLAKVRSGLKRGDFCFLYFTGHAKLVIQGQTQLPYLAVAQSRLRDDASTQRTSLNLKVEIEAWLINQHPADTLILLDCCYAGATLATPATRLMDVLHQVFAHPRPTAGNKKPAGPPPTRVLMAACAEDERAYANAAISGGYFTRAVLDGCLYGGAGWDAVNGDGIVTTGSIDDSIATMLGGRQHPRIYATDQQLALRMTDTWRTLRHPGNPAENPPEVIWLTSTADAPLHNPDDPNAPALSIAPGALAIDGLLNGAEARTQPRRFTLAVRRTDSVSLWQMERSTNPTWQEAGQVAPLRVPHVTVQIDSEGQGVTLASAADPPLRYDILRGQPITTIPLPGSFPTLWLPNDEYLLTVEGTELAYYPRGAAGGGSVSTRAGAFTLPAPISALHALPTRRHFLAIAVPGTFWVGIIPAANRPPETPLTLQPEFAREGGFGYEPLASGMHEQEVGLAVGYNDGVVGFWLRSAPQGHFRAQTIPGLTLFQHYVSAVAFAEDGQTFACGSGDGTVQLVTGWHTPEAATVTRIDVRTHLPPGLADIGVTALAFAPGRFGFPLLVIGTTVGHLICWDITAARAIMPGIPAKGPGDILALHLLDDHPKLRLISVTAQGISEWILTR